MANRFRELFQVKKPIIGMLHLAGKDPVKQALEEIAIYEEEGVDGVIVEDYYGTIRDVENTLRESSKLETKIIIGVNVLKDPYYGFELAQKFRARFVQLDSVQSNHLNREYDEYRKKYPDICVLGGVGFKYTSPSGMSLQSELEIGKSRADAIVTTGEGTGIETPLKKLKQYKELLREFPLISGAGINDKNVSPQLSVADGGIVGTFFKVDGKTYNPLSRIKIRKVMSQVREIRAS